MTLRAHVQIDYLSFGIAITIVNTGDADRAAIYGVDADGRIRPQWSSHDERTVTANPTIRIDEDAARVLMDALLDHFRGGSDGRELRKDFEREQGRVDKLTDALIVAALGPGSARSVSS
jgi:hypothetical protein